MRRAACLVLLAFVAGCAPPKPPVVVPTPAPTPVPTPTPIVVPTPNPCLPAPPLGKFEAKNVGQFRVVIDATPKTCASPEWNIRCSNGQACAPGGVEGLASLQREMAEGQWGPYTWEILDPASGRFFNCLITGECFLDNANVLRVVAPGMEGRTIRITGGNGVAQDTVGARIQP